jgi:hypothetical protein
MSSVKFNVYYSLTPNGPWVLSNPSPLDADDSGHNAYTVTGLKNNTKYYFSIIPGVVQSGVFYPLNSQPIGPSSNGAVGVGVNRGKTISVKSFAPKAITESSLGQQFEVV